MKLLRNNILVKLPERKTQTNSGLIIPDTVHESRITTGIVREIGLGKIANNGQVIPPTVQPGNVIMFDLNKSALKLENREIIISEDNILCILEKEADVQDNNSDLAGYL